VAQAGADIASSAFGPTLNLIGNICAIGCFGGAQQGASGSVRLSLSVPLYSGGALGAQVRQANLEQIQSEVDAMATRDQVREAVITSWSTLQNATAQIASAQTAVESGNLVLEGVIQERDVGQRTTLDVLNAQAELIAAREGLISATSTRSIATFSLIAATGRLSAVELGLNVRIRNGEEYRATVEDVWQELRALDVEQ
jgi:outer membrane protein